MKIKPCPFCGSNDLCPDYEDRGLSIEYSSWIVCGKCSSNGPCSKWENSYTEAESAAIQAWNQRANNGG
ncbi:Lar family restriction alleviation protein [Xenorhabdus khoisanae]|uniref:Lar family restriction alleviation protein n=1 Tax=Xenorhabdus khoisanae TaxID=880157 RepID=UPI003D6DED44